MARTTVDAVKLTMDVGNLTDPQITAFINTANILTTNVLGDSELGATTLTEIELYLSCHLCALRRRQKESEKISSAAVKYGGDFGMFLDFTQYGQTAKVLDTTGALEELGKMPASLEVLEITVE